MSNSYDFPALARQLLSNIDSYLSGWLPNGRREGREWVAVNPTRPDSKPGSFKVNLATGKWSDFATGDRGGDLTSLYQYLKGCDAKQAYADLSGEAVKNFAYTKNKGNTKPANFEEIVEAVDIPDDAPPMPAPKGKALEPLYKDPVTGEGLYPVTYYKDYKGKVVYRVITRRNKETGNKYPIPTSYCRWKREQTDYDREKKQYIKTGKIIDTTGWNQKDIPDKVPLCGMNYVFERIEAPVLVVEGEKAWASIIARFPDYAAVTWRGGTQRVKKADWSVLRERNVIICPDYDEPGQRAALEIANILKRQGNNVKICWEPISGGFHEQGWDLADETDPEAVRAYLKKTAVFLSTVEAMINEQNGEDEIVNDIGSNYNKLFGNVAVQILDRQGELRCLGYGADNKVYFICRERGVVVGMTADQMANINQMLSLMPLKFWYELFPTPKGGVDKNEMSDALHRWADSKGYFDPRKIRGAGVWSEKDGEFILHAGQKLLKGDKEISINEFKSSYMYEATSDLKVNMCRPLPNVESKKLVDICSWLSWECPVYAKMLAGFCAIAPMCGGLEWRPHIWVTGSSGSGKTTVISNILYKACGELSLFVLGDTTAAGVRQELGTNALPVIFDECEGETPKRLESLQQCLDLARAASSDIGAKTVKGSSSGESVEFRTRSCFAFSAINPNIKHWADASRITILTLKDPPKDLSPEEKTKRIDSYNEFMRNLEATLTEDWVNALHIRTFKLLPVIRQNAKIFKEAVIRKLGGSRAGDQLGALCAGAYSLEHTDVIEKAVAEEWVNNQDWSKTTTTGEGTDPEKCLWYILQWILQMQIDGEKHYESFSIGELIHFAANENKRTGKQADLILKRYGIKVDPIEKKVYIANSHSNLAKIMQNTAYQTWRHLLLRFEGAQSSETPIRFAEGTVARAVSLPIDIVLSGADEKFAF